MTEYCTVADLVKRLTAVGQKYVADLDRDGTVTSTESLNYLTESIERAGRIIDEYLTERHETADLRGSGNGWCKDRCVDLAMYEAITIGGRTAPESVQEIRDNAMERLNEIKAGGRIPGYNYSIPTTGSVPTTIPKRMPAKRGRYWWRRA